MTKITYQDTKELRGKLASLIFDSDEDFTIQTGDLESLWKVFKSHFKIIVAAGGIVEKEDKFLFILRHGKWDIPKGKLEKGEDEQTGAIREIEEECNIHGPTILKKICNTYHHYELNGKQILKKSVWYYLVYDGDDQLIPQTEEGITEVKWFYKDEFNSIRANTFASIIQVLDEFESLSK